MATPGELPPRWVVETGVVGTWVVALVALLGPRFWAWWSRPQLRVELVNDKGDLEVETVSWVDVESGAGGAVRIPRERRREARYYRLRVLNERQASVVQDVQVVIDAIERPLPNGKLVMEYRGPLPLVWQHAPAFPQFRSVGTAAVADFLVVTEEQTLRLMTAITPNKYAEEYVGATQLWVTVAARGRERDSPPMRFRIDWDGQWDRGETEMQRHLTIADP